MIRILPLLSGYKYVDEDTNDKDTKERIQWTQRYDIHKDSTGIIIPRNKILNFSPYVESDHEKLVFGDSSSE